MSENTKIQWAHHTWNPWIGCTKVSPGCANCYAERLAARLKVKWGTAAPRRPASESAWKLPLRWNARAGRLGVRYRVFPSLCDPLDPEVPFLWRCRLADLIEQTPNLDWLLLTKRPGFYDGSVLSGFDNVWLGTSVEDQQRANERIPAVISSRARVKFLSCEPLLGPVSLPRAVVMPIAYNGRTGRIEPVTEVLDWVIVGGESGPKARVCDPFWIASIVGECRGLGIPCFVKQLGSCSVHRGDALVIKDPKGGDPEEWPRSLRVRQIPDVGWRRNRSCKPTGKE